MYTLKDCQEQKDILQASILQTVGQGDDALTEHIAPHVDTSWCLHSQTRFSCDLRYFLTQRDLIQMALGFVRNQVDTSSTRGRLTSSSSRTSDSTRDAHSRRKGHAIACSWSSATSYRTFARDSSAADKSESHAWATSSGSFARNSSSSSSRSAMAWSYGISSANTDVNGLNQMDGVQTHSRGATSSSSNFKRNTSYSTDIQISAPLIGTVRWRAGFSGVGDWGNKSDSASVDTVFGKTDSTATTIATSNSNTDDSGASTSTSKSVSNAGGTSSQYGSSAATAQAAGIASSHAEAHSGSQNTSHAEAEQAAEFTSRSNYLATGKTESSSDDTLKTEGSKWGQIFDGLNALLQETMRQIEEIKRAISANSIPVLLQPSGVICSPIDLIKMPHNGSPYMKRIGR